MLIGILNTKGKPMNSNNLENEKLPIDQGVGNEETSKEIPVEEVTSNQTEEVDNQKSVADDTSEVVSEEVDNVKTDSTDEKEIDYHLEDVEETEEDEEEIDENNVEDDGSIELLSLEDIIQKLRDLLASENPQRRDIDEAKNHFYRSLRNETDTQKKAFIETGGESIDFVMHEGEFYTEGKELIQKIKEKRAEITAREDAEKEKNVAKKTCNY